MKTITINNKDYKINFNALTYLYYRKIFDKNIFDDIDTVRDYLLLQMKVNNLEENNRIKETEQLLVKLNFFIDAISRLTYSAIYTQNQDIEDYAKWIEKNSILEQDNDCMTIVIENVVDCFIDEKVSNELRKINRNSGDDIKILFPEHYFLSACLKSGLTMQDLSILTYNDVMKIFLSITKKEKKKRKATQSDWDKLANR